MNNDEINVFEKDVAKKKENLCEIGFWISVVGFIVMFFNLVFSWMIYIIVLYFAAQGLKTRKKGKAIATIVLSIIPIILFVMKFVELMSELA